MSIRMRLAPTYLRNRQPNSDRTRMRIGRLAMTALVAASVLTGCLVGDADEAQRGMLEDAQRTSVVDELQATESARLLAPSTPETAETDEP